MTFRFGVELECETSAIAEDEIGEYHDGNEVCAGWTAEHDGSLEAEGDNQCVEFVTRVFTRDELGLLFTRLRRELGEEGDTMDTISINKTCGCHVHFSHPQLKAQIINRQTIERMRELFFAKLGEKLPYDVYNKIKHNHHRRYAARVLSEEDMYSTRYLELIYDGRTHSFEWRSINLNGCKKWSEIMIVLDTALDAIETCLTPEFRKKKMFETMFKVDYQKMVKNKREVVSLHV